MRFNCLLSSGLVFGIFLLPFAPVANAQIDKSDSKVKIKATASNVNAAGIQVISVNIKIAKGWNLYANPTENEIVERSATKLKVTGNNVKNVRVIYPKGEQKIDDGVKYRIYKNEVRITAFVERTDGKATPLNLAVDVSACNDKKCLFPATVKLKIK